MKANCALLIVAAWLLGGYFFQNAGAVEAERNCTEVLQEKGCHTLWEFLNCDDRVNISRAFINEQLGIRKVGSNEYVATIVWPSAQWGDESSPLFANDTLREFASAWLGSQIPGIWTLDDLVAAGSVSTSLGRQLNDTSCCNFTFTSGVDKQPKVSTPDGDWSATVRGVGGLCYGGQIIFVDAPELPVMDADIDDVNVMPGMLADLSVYDGISEGACGTTLQDMFDKIASWVPDNPTLSAELKPLLPDSSITASDFAVTWFVPSRNSYNCMLWYNIITWNDNIQGNYRQTTHDSRECCYRCMEDPACDSYQFTPASEECLLKDSSLSEPGATAPQKGLDWGVVGLTPKHFDSPYWLYHMLPGAHCTDELMAGGGISANSLLGMATDTYLPLNFSRAQENSNVSMTMLSLYVDDHGNIVPDAVKKTVTILNSFSLCRSIIHIVSDDFYPPYNYVVTNTSLRPENVLFDNPPLSLLDNERDLPEIDMLFGYVGNASRKYHDLVWQEGCNNQLMTSSRSSGIQSPSSPVSSNDSSSVEGGSGVSIGVIIGVAVGVAVALIILAALLAFAWRRWRRQVAMGSSDGVLESGGKGVDGVLPVSLDSTGVKSTTLSSSAGGSSSKVSPTASGSHLPPGSVLTRSADSAYDDKMAAFEDYLKTVPNDWVIEGMEFIKLVGAGSFGTVYLGRWHDAFVAVKKFGGNGASGMDIDENQWKEELLSMQKEVSIMSGLRHPNVVQFLGVTTHPPSVVMEYCHHGSLYHVLRKALKDPATMQQLSWPRRVAMAMEAAKGMQFLHSRKVPIIHRDLKSPNLLVDKSWNVKVTDFGLSKIVDLASSRTSLAVLNPRWLAPELINPSEESCGRSTPASDVYAFGIIMWELLTFQEPFEDMQPARIIFNVVQSALRPPIPALSDLPCKEPHRGVQQYIQLLQECWHQDPEQRPNFKTIVDKLGAIRKTAVRSASSAPLLDTAGKADSNASSETVDVARRAVSDATAGLPPAEQPERPVSPFRRPASPFSNSPAASPYNSSIAPQPFSNSPAASSYNSSIAPQPPFPLASNLDSMEPQHLSMSPLPEGTPQASPVPSRPQSPSPHSPRRAGGAASPLNSLSPFFSSQSPALSKNDGATHVGNTSSVVSQLGSTSPFGQSPVNSVSPFCAGQSPVVLRISDDSSPFKDAPEPPADSYQPSLPLLAARSVSLRLVTGPQGPPQNSSGMPPADPAGPHSASPSRPSDLQEFRSISFKTPGMPPADPAGPHSASPSWPSDLQQVASISFKTPGSLQSAPTVSLLPSNQSASFHLSTDDQGSTPAS